MDGERFEYSIDGNDVITHVNEAWRSFARGNAGDGLEDRAVGSWLWQHLAGVEVKHLFKTLVERVRLGQEAVRIPFRCDAPALRRHMMLEASPLPGENVHFVSWVVEAEERDAVPLLEAFRNDDPDQLLRMCAWCKRIEAGGGGWLEVEDAVTAMNLFHLNPLPKITHGVCPECQASIMTEMGGRGP